MSPECTELPGCGSAGQGEGDFKTSVFLSLLVYLERFYLDYPCSCDLYAKIRADAACFGVCGELAPSPPRSV